jgi:MFS family permease
LHPHPDRTGPRPDAGLDTGSGQDGYDVHPACPERNRKLVPRFGPRPLAVSGLALTGAGLVLLGHVPAGGTYTASILPGLVLIGFGVGLSFVSITTAALARVEKTAAGLASGLLSSAAQLGVAVGLAVIVALAITRSSSSLLSTGSTAVAAQANGLRLGFLLASGVALAASLVAAIALPR